MKLLALDTSSHACTVALQDGDRVTERHRVEPRMHTKILLPLVAELLDESGLQVSGLDALVLGNGPGSFIGLRIAASVAQGLAFASGLPIVPVSSMRAIAAEVMDSDEASAVCVTQDARMGEVYLGCYLCDADAGMTTVATERLHGDGEISELVGGGRNDWIVAGAGWTSLPKLLENNRDWIGGQSGVLHPRGKYLLQLGAPAFRQDGGLPPEKLELAYLRHKVAEIPST
jgi:tRNA threonylcarbamoyladenosine biosynthesis protein TsaB